MSRRFAQRVDRTNEMVEATCTCGLCGELPVFETKVVPEPTRSTFQKGLEAVECRSHAFFGLRSKLSAKRLARGNSVPRLRALGLRPETRRLAHSLKARRYHFDCHASIAVETEQFGLLYKLPRRAFGSTVISDPRPTKGERGPLELVAWLDPPVLPAEHRSPTGVVVLDHRDAVSHGDWRENQVNQGFRKSRPAAIDVKAGLDPLKARLEEVHMRVHLQRAAGFRGPESSGGMSSICHQPVSNFGGQGDDWSRTVRNSSDRAKCEENKCLVVEIEPVGVSGSAVACDHAHDGAVTSHMPCAHEIKAMFNEVASRAAPT